MQQKFVLLERLLVLPQVPHVGAVLSRDVCSWKIPSLPGLPRSCFNMRLENPKCQQTVGQSVKHIQSLNRLSFSFFLLCKLKNGKKFHQLATKPTVILPALPVSDFCIHTQSCLPITRLCFLFGAVAAFLMSLLGWIPLSQWKSPVAGLEAGRGC